MSSVETWSLHKLYFRQQIDNSIRRVDKDYYDYYDGDRGGGHGDEEDGEFQYMSVDIEQKRLRTKGNILLNTLTIILHLFIYRR